MGSVGLTGVSFMEWGAGGVEGLGCRVPGW